MTSRTNFVNSKFQLSRKIIKELDSDEETVLNINPKERNEFQANGVEGDFNDFQALIKNETKKIGKGSKDNSGVRGRSVIDPRDGLGKDPKIKADLATKRPEQSAKSQTPIKKQLPRTPVKKTDPVKSKSQLTEISKQRDKAIVGGINRAPRVTERKVKKRCQDSDVKPLKGEVRISGEEAFQKIMARNEEFLQRKERNLKKLEKESSCSFRPIINARSKAIDNQRLKGLQSYEY